MQIFNHTNKIQEYLSNTKNIALIPTMGGLHNGHLSLIKIAKKRSKIIIVSIFVNPEQFGKNEDFDSYPRNLITDIEKLKEEKVDILFIPNINEIYPKGYNFKYDICYLQNILCAKSRPNFLPGVVKVVYRLFNIIKPNIAVFGEKDYQQLLAIKQMVIKEKLDIEIISGEIKREKNGLAQSTRNKYLNTDEFRDAANIYKILKEAKKQVKILDINEIKDRLNKKLNKKFNLEYFEILDSKNLGKINENTIEIIILVALKLGETRLIDNLRIKYV